MKVAIVSDAMELTGLVPKAFRDAEYLMIIDADTNVLTRVYPKEDLENICFARHIVEEDCEVLICGELQKEAFEIIAGAMVTRYDGSTKKVQRAYDYMKRGKLAVIRDHVEGTGVGHTHDFSCDCGEEGETEIEDRPLVFDGVITAAGLSSRMGDYKPLMDLGGMTVIRRILTTYLEAGVRKIHVVGGHRFEELKAEVLSCCPEEKVHFRENREYEATDMLASVRIGLRSCWEEESPADGVYVVPVDAPLFTKFTLDNLADWFSMGEEEVYRPVCEDKGGHPLLIRTSAIPRLMSGDESLGLKSVLTQPGIRMVNVDGPDRGATLDANTPEEFYVLQEELRDRQAPCEETCLRILQWAGVMEEGMAHAGAVAGMADALVDACCEKAEARGILLNRERIHSAALLHDVLKGMRDHEKRGAELLSELGMPEVAELVATHGDLQPEMQKEISDGLILFLADKMVAGDHRVTISERFAEKEQQFRANKAAMAGLKRRKSCAEKALAVVRAYGWEE